MRTTAEGNGGGALLLRRTILLLAVGALMMVMLAMSGSAGVALAAGNPTSHDAPYAAVDSGSQGSQGGCVTTYKGPTSPPKSDARGGNPGQQGPTKSVGHGC